VSKAQAWQRSGRAGREAPGICYRLYTEDEFDRLTENTTPEIVRSVQKVKSCNMFFNYTHKFILHVCCLQLVFTAVDNN